MKRLFFSLGLTSSLLLTAVSGAGAQPSAADKTTAQALFDAALKEMDAGRFNDACPKLAESQRLDPSIGTKYYLADCLEKQGRISAALTYFGEVAAEARALKQADREKFAKKRADALGAKVPKLVLAVPDAVKRLEGLSIKRDGAVIGEILFGVPVPLDPGNHVVEVAAKGKASWEQKVELKADGATITLTIEPPAPPKVEPPKVAPPKVVEPPKPPPAAAPPKPLPAAALPDKPAPERRRISLVPSYVLFGLGGATAIAGAALLIKGTMDKGAYEDKAPSQRTANEYDDLRRTAAIGDVMLGATITLGAAGLVSLLVIRSVNNKAPASGLWITPQAGKASGGAQMGFVF